MTQTGRRGGVLKAHFDALVSFTGMQWGFSRGLLRDPETINYGEHPMEQPNCPPKSAGMPVS